MINAYDSPSQKNYTDYNNEVNAKYSALNTQVAGDHYKKQGLQPFEITFANFGYKGVQAAVYTKVNKYLTREKGDHRENVEKAIHCLQIQLELYNPKPNEPNSSRLEPRFSSSTPIDGNK